MLAVLGTRHKTEPSLRAALKAAAALLWRQLSPVPSVSEIVNALFYQNRTGCQWMLLPHDLPPWSAVYYYFKLWRDDGTDQAIHDLLRCHCTRLDLGGLCPHCAEPVAINDIIEQSR